MVVIRIAADWLDLGQRGSKQPPDLFQFRAPCKDRRVAMTVGVPQAGGEKSKPGFIEEQRRVMQNELALTGQLQDPAGNAFGKQEGADENRGINGGAYWHRSVWPRRRQPEFRLPVRG